MAGALTDIGNLKRAHLYEYRLITGYFIFACVIAASGGSLFGYDLGVSGGVTSMDDFLKEFIPTVYKKKHAHLHETDYCKNDNKIFSLFTSSLYFAALVTTFGASYVTRTRGRRASILVGSTSFFIGVIVNAFAKNVETLIIGRCFLVGGIGFGNRVTKNIPLLRRGILVANFINYGSEKIHPSGRRLSLGLATLPATVMFVGELFLPETPNSLIEQGRLEEGRRILEKNRPQLVIGAMGIPALQQLTGNNSILFYAPVIFQSLVFSNIAALYSSVITNAALVVGALMSMAFVDKFGRRAFFLEAGAEMHVAVGLILPLDFGDGKPIPHGTGIFLVVIICLFVLAYGRSWGPLGWLVPSEIFPLETRSAGQSQCFVVSLCHLKYGIFLQFAGLIFIMSTFIYFLLPETKQVPIEEMHLLWQNHRFRRKIMPEQGKLRSRV
ncbi:hypothetical protein MANES_16G111500v8 [Manihot esculenta]|uniref:Uncharacterized protein n=1 Tax=Manihot esculenta TaxID=3983 RepID=A0ACB7G7S7_MANES|nr:hypothetical protein MANES_16G111500v8 [Manihot esculenta]